MFYGVTWDTRERVFVYKDKEVSSCWHGYRDDTSLLNIADSLFGMLRSQKGVSLCLLAHVRPVEEVV